MRPRKTTVEDLVYWTVQEPDKKIAQRIFKSPEWLDNSEDVEALIVGDTIQVPWVSDERDDTKILGTVWLTIHGKGMPPVDVVVTVP